MAIGWDEANPTDNSIVSQFPANERAQRAVQASAWAIEHDDVEGRHAFLTGNTATRDAITTWTTGAIFINTSAGTPDSVLQVVVSVTASVPGWANLTRFLSADEAKLDAVISAGEVTSAEASAGTVTSARMWTPAKVFTAIEGHIATTAETITGTNTNDYVTPAAMKGAIGFSEFFESAEQTLTANTVFTIAHGLGGVPNLVQAILRCKTGENGYSAGDEVVYQGYNGATDPHITIFSDSTNVGAAYGQDSTTFSLANKSTAADDNNLTMANWVLVLRAWR